MGFERGNYESDSKLQECSVGGAKVGIDDQGEAGPMMDDDGGRLGGTRRLEWVMYDGGGYVGLEFEDNRRNDDDMLTCRRRH